MPKKIPCCKTMDAALQDDPHRAGLSVLVLTDLKSGEVRTAGITSKKSAADRGIVLNFCPWCREDLRPLLGSEPAVPA
jgi:hypothetical protein